MTEQRTTSGRRVLHVAPTSHTPAERVSDALRQAGCEVVPCTDVYRALARMGGSERGRLCAVVVCVDLMDTGQFEFFQLAARHHRRVGVYVYAQPHAQSKIDLALRLGAKDTIRAEAVDRVLPYRAPAPAPAPCQPASAESATAEPAGMQPVEEPADSVTAARSDGERGEGPQPEKEELAGPARVPWLRYEGGPKRIPPQPTPARAKSPQPADREVESEPPLLTPEELAALIGDEDAGDPVNGRGKRGRRR